jgi:threonine/homoserine/homoserine lactone efflux protein
MGTLIGLIGFSIVSSVTPGPNNVLLLASGSTFGFRRTAPHILGTAVGIGVMAVAVGAGLGLLIASRPEVGVAMRVTGSAYLLTSRFRSLGPGVPRAQVVRRSGSRRRLPSS